MLEGSIGPYRVEREIGRGGMGVVYLAMDTRLDRAVAIKTLPDELAGDAGRLERFEREARTLAQLQHPNVAGIYGVEERDGHKHLVLEFVEGETLADRLDRGPLPVAEALEFAVQIAAGIEAAHEAGVIHRDLKPANVKITPTGEVKVLDFGLARVDESSTSGSFTENPTLTTPAHHTMPGAIMGTAAYMSPEQARGRRVDRRTDVWSFGVVLYEMLTGSGPFVGETVSDSIAAILHKDADLDRLPAATPPIVRYMLTRCLERDRASRYRDIGDVRLEIERARTGENAMAPAPLPARRRTGALAAAVLVAVATAAAAGVAAWTLKPSPAPEPRDVARLAITLPWERSRVGQLALSSDGRTLAVIALEQTQPERLWSVNVRRLDRQEFERVHELRSAPRMLSFTPDGRDLIVGESNDTTRDRVYRVPVAGGRPTPLLDADTDEFLINGVGGSFWISDDEFLVQGERQQRTIFAVSKSSGATREVATFPAGLVDQVRLLGATRDARFAILASATVAAGDVTFSLKGLNLATGDAHTITDRANVGILIDEDIILLDRGDVWYAARFDPRTCTISGELTPIDDEMASWTAARGRGHAVYFLPDAQRGSLSIIDRGGDVRMISPARRLYSSIGLRTSLDGRFLSTHVPEEVNAPRATLSAVEVATGIERRILVGIVFPMRWIADGRLAYFTLPDSSTLTEDNKILVSLNTWSPSGETSVLVSELEIDNNSAVDLSPDGTIMAHVARTDMEGGPGSRGSVVELIDLTARPPVSTRYLQPGAWIRSVRFSPDGQWLAYAAGTTTRTEVYATRFDPGAPARPVRVSGAGAWDPFWSIESDELFFFSRTADGTEEMLMSAALEPGDAGTFAAPARVLEGEQYDDGYLAPLPGDQGFAFVDRPEPSPDHEHLMIVLNWVEELRRRLPQR